MITVPSTCSFTAPHRCDLGVMTFCIAVSAVVQTMADEGGRNSESGVVPNDMAIVTIPLPKEDANLPELVPGAIVDICHRTEFNDGENSRRAARLELIADDVEIYSVAKIADSGTTKTQSVSLRVTSEQSLRIQKARGTGSFQVRSADSATPEGFVTTFGIGPLDESGLPFAVDVPPRQQVLTPSVDDPPPLPTLEDVKNNRRFDWLILKDDKIMVIKPVEPRPDTLAKIKAEIETLTAARGGLTAERKARQERIQELQWLTVTLLEHPGTEYKLKIDQIKEIRHFEDLVREQATEFSMARDDKVASQGKELLAALRNADRRHKNSPGKNDPGEARVVVRDMLLMAGQFVDVQLIFPDGRNQVLPHVQIEALTSRIERTIQRVDSQKEFPQVTQESVVHEAVLKLTPVQQESFAQAKSRKILRTVDHPDAAHAWDAENSGQPSQDRQPEERETVERVATPFVGEWRLRSVEHDDYAKSIRSSEELAAADKALRTNVFIRDNQLHFGDDLFEFAFQKVNSFTWQVIEPEHLKNSVVLEQLGTILRVESMPLEGITRLVFGKVDPERDALVRQIAETTAQLTAARIDGPQRAISQLEAHLGLLNERLQRLDQIPEVDSLQLDALIARDAGDHAEAAKLEAEAKTLADRNRSHDSSGENHQQETIESPTDENEIQRLTDELQRTEIASTTRAQQLRELESSGDGFKGDVETIETELKRLVTKAFELRWQLQDLRLKKSRVDLEELEGKHRRRKELADQIIDRRLEGLRIGDETAWLQTNSEVGRASQSESRQSPNASNAGVRSAQPGLQTSAVPSFQTPDELLQYLGSSETAGIASLQRYVEQLTEEETQRVAGVALRTIAGLKGIAGLFAVFGSQDNDGTSKEDFGRMIAELSSVLDQRLLDDPPAEATAAHKRIQPNLNPITAFLGSTSAAIVPAARYSETLRTAAGVLDDPRAFLTDILAVATAMEKEFGGDQEPPEKPNWKITLSGDKATAIDLNAEDSDESASEDSSSPIKPSASIELTRINGVWRISSVLTDEAILEFQKGFEPKVTETSESESVEATAPVVMATPSASVANDAGYIAKNDLVPFTKLTSGDIRVSPGSPFGNGDSSKPARVFGRYVNKRVESGENITEAMLVDEPTVQQIVDVYISEARAGRFFGYTEREASLVQSLKADELGWITHYIAAVVKELDRKPGYEWAQDEFRLLSSLETLVLTQTVNSPIDLKPLEDLLFRKVPFQKLGDELAKHLSPLWHSHDVLRIVGRFPSAFRDELFDRKCNDAAVVRKLKLLEELSSNGANTTWIQQERVRLEGVLDEAPLEALKVLLNGTWDVSEGNHARPIDSMASVWLNHLSSEEIYKAWHEPHAVASLYGSEQTERTNRTPCDPILVLLALRHLAGNSELTDSRVNSFFRAQSEFTTHLSEILRSNLRCRELVVDALIEIYHKTQDDGLKRTVARLAPAVPVRVRKMEANVVEPLLLDGTRLTPSNAQLLPRHRIAIYGVLKDTTHISVGSESINNVIRIDSNAHRRLLAKELEEIFELLPDTAALQLTEGDFQPLHLSCHSEAAQVKVTQLVCRKIAASISRPYEQRSSGVRRIVALLQNDAGALKDALKAKNKPRLRFTDSFAGDRPKRGALPHRRESRIFIPETVEIDEIAAALSKALTKHESFSVYGDSEGLLITGQPYEQYSVILEILDSLDLGTSQTGP